MNIFSFNPKTQEILYEDGAIRHYLADHCCLVCPASLDEIAELNGHKVDHYHVDGHPVSAVDNWMPGAWTPEASELHAFLKANKECVVLEVESSEFTACAKIVMLAIAQKIDIHPIDSRYKKTLEELKSLVDDLLQIFGHQKKAA